MINKQEINDKCNDYYLTRVNEKYLDKVFESMVTFETFATILESPILLGGAALSGIAIFINLLSLRNECIQYCSYLGHLNNMKDEDYVHLKEKYDIYVDKLAKHIESKNITDPLDIGFYFCRLLYSGNLSLNNDYIHFQFLNMDHHHLFFPLFSFVLKNQMGFPQHFLFHL